MDVPVLIAGGGPVGMILSLELAHHGVRSILIERNPTTTRHPKMDLTNGRSMELLARLGVVDILRAAGVPSGNCFDIVRVSHGLPGVGKELFRFAYPSPDEVRRMSRETNDGTLTREPPLRISQILLEPALLEVIRQNPLIDARFGWTVQSFEQDEDSVRVAISETDGTATETIECAYLAGCDGGGSNVRRGLGIKYEGDFAVGSFYMVHFRSDALDALQPDGPWWHWLTNAGGMVAQNDRDLWTLHTPVPEGMAPESVDPRALLRNWAGRDFDFEILVANPWTPHMVVAERYGEGRVWMAGDSVHQFMPTGGYGMNTGVGDAVDLGWKLAAVIHGWGGPALLRSYEEERRPIAIQNRAASRRHLDVNIAIWSASPATTDDDKAWDHMAEEIERLGNAENESWGIEHGYRYAGSPIIAPDGTPEPPFDPDSYRPTTWPGARLPHYYLEDGNALHDLLGPGFTLINCRGADTGPLEDAAAQMGLPLKIVGLHDPKVCAAMERPLLLVRPDQHVAWRGTELPADCLALLRRVTGWQSALEREIPERSHARA
ncbi:FAD-monooxygenase [Sphingomonas sp. BHC-A]|uniref:FAD-monooxygenase n=1 Tax=Sphingobium indicum (strain DSM 16412 / CCM 7286 / MTCC 6364 / B90A) TaxID=861109 RepID=A0A1L5BQ81_SPHIB|nr:FAD-dependent monooxygenase [Sphingobium indicum]APL95070.1 FAD-monooxygenase [Sphingobium indicum B90A]KEY99324.1 FAD-monooxygenase [Sphingomonas sp. BHC-A]